jgi:outer membrane lipoprotein-sorting protein
VSSLTVARRHPSLRWLVPLGITVALAVLTVDALQDRNDAISLPAISAQQLVAETRDSARPAFSGTALAQVSSNSTVLAGLMAAGAPSVELGAVPAGSHTVRVWYGAPSQQRVALVDPLTETDLFRVGGETWEWNSAEGVAVHGALSTRPANSLWTAPITPIDLADRLLTTASTDTEATVAGAEMVAGRAAYGLVLRPTSADSLVDYVHIAVDGSTKIPLAVQIYPRGAEDAAVDVSFTTISVARQPARLFAFHPPAGATVRQAGPAEPDVEYGTGWSAVLCYRAPEAARALEAPAQVDRRGTARGGRATARLVQLPLLSALITADGRAFVGPVTPNVLYAAAAHTPAS